ncbi:MAG: molybdopterin-dependent oxidoreductase, partial [Nitrospirota bacterium]|nr:molybdopterin-dependent oxidoreductase [Nitrospirota bacterium]
MGITRRDFLKYSAIATATTAGGVPVFQSITALGEKPEIAASYIPTFCEICCWNCGAVAKVVNKKVVKLEGNPLSLRGRGRLCGRGNAGLGLLYDPDRLKYPMINVGKRGEPEWKKVSWDEALGFVAEKMKKIKETHGPEALAFLGHGGGE